MLWIIFNEFYFLLHEYLFIKYIYIGLLLLLLASCFFVNKNKKLININNISLFFTQITVWKTLTLAVVKLGMNC
jgi:hypothetical protein